MKILNLSKSDIITELNIGFLRGFKHLTLIGVLSLFLGTQLGYEEFYYQTEIRLLSTQKRRKRALLTSFPLHLCQTQKLWPP